MAKSMENSKILVTSGNIGDGAIKYLMSKGHKVRIAVREIKPHAIWDSAGLEQVVFDFAKPASMQKAFEGVKTYISVSPLIENLVETAELSFKLAKQSGVEVVIRSSAMGASQESPITLGRWHGHAENLLKESGLKYTVIRPASFMQNYLMSADTIKNSNSFYLPLGNGKASLVDVSDVGEAIGVLALKEHHSGEIFVATGPEALSAQEIANKISEFVGKKVQYIDVPEDNAEKNMLENGMPAWLVKCLMELNMITKAGYVADVSQDLEVILGRKQNNFNSFLHKHGSLFK